MVKEIKFLLAETPMIIKEVVDHIVPSKIPKEEHKVET
jgi:hypothetical protein